jgi:hypothetical protein
MSCSHCSPLQEPKIIVLNETQLKNKELVKARKSAGLEPVQEPREKKSKGINKFCNKCGFAKLAVVRPEDTGVCRCSPLQEPISSTEKGWIKRGVKYWKCNKHKLIGTTEKCDKCVQEPREKK